jgi:hypothetical protein
MKRFTVYVFIIILFIPFFGCDSENPATYEATVTWNISDIQICRQALPEDYIIEGEDSELVFDNVEIKVYDNEGDQETVQEGVAKCDAFSYTLYGLERGEYFVTVGAIATYDGVTLPYFQGDNNSLPDEVDFVVPTEEEEPYDFTLTLGTGKVTVTWDFEQGVCGANGVSELDVTLTGAQPSHQYAVRKIPCDLEGGLVIEDVEWDVYNILVQGFNGEEQLTHIGESAEDFKVRPGEHIGDLDPEEEDLRAFVTLLEN